MQSSYGHALGEPAGFGALLRRCRDAAGLTQEELAERTGLSVRAIGDLERGRVRRPRWRTVVLLADALELEGQARSELGAAARHERDQLAGVIAPEEARGPGAPPAAGVPAAGVPAAADPAPCWLPPDISDFTGRAREVADLCALLTRGSAALDPGHPTALVIAGVVGMAGVGKTTLAVHVAHQLRARGQAPDGQLYVNLHGVEGCPVRPEQVLARFLRALGVGGATIPNELEERVELYRARMANRRALVVLDNAADEGQVRPLLPGGAGCAVLVTSRERLTGLAAAHVTELDVLDADEAVELLAGIVGPARVAAEPAATKAIVGACGRLPLAVRVAGVRLAAKPHWPLARLASSLGDQRRRLDELKAGDLEIRASVALSYQAVGPDAQLVFRRLGLLQAPDFPAWVAAALLDAPRTRAEALVERLVDAQLLQAAGRDQVDEVRYRFHDLVRAFAREHVDADGRRDEHRAGLQRTLGAWLALAEDAHARLPSGVLAAGRCAAPRWRLESPPVAPVAAPLDWFEAERGSLVEAVAQAAALGLDELAWGIAGTAARFLALRSYFDDWRHSHEVALVATSRADNLRGQAYMLRGLAELSLEQDRAEEGIALLERALALFQQLGDHLGAALVQRTIGASLRARGRHAEALACLEQVLSVFEAHGDRTGVAYARYELGNVRYCEGRWDEALARYQQVLTDFKQLGDRQGEAQVLRMLGQAELRQGNLDRARSYLTRSLDTFQQVGDQLDAAYAMEKLGELDLRAGRYPAAHALLDQALAAYRTLGDAYGEALALRSLGELCSAEGAFSQAEAYLRRALQVFEAQQLPLPQARTLSSLGEVYAASGDATSACTAWRNALCLFERLNAPEAAAVAARLNGTVAHDR